MDTCNNPQYIVRNGPSADYDIETYAIKPGAEPSLIVEVPEGSRTIPAGTEQEIVSRVARMMTERGFCKLPESLAAPDVEGDSEIEQTTSGANVPEGLGALGNNFARRNQTQTTAIEEVPATPDIYTRKLENAQAVDATGPGIIGGMVMVGGAVGAAFWGFDQLQKRMFPVTTQSEVINYESEQPENIYHAPVQPVPATAATVVHEPSPWARTAVYAGNPHQTGHFGRNEVRNESRNDSEMSPKRVEMTPEMSFISPKMSSVDSDQIDRLRTRLSGIFQNSETVDTQAISGEMKSEMKSISDYFDPEGDLTQAKATYFMLREQGIHTATDLGGAIFGIRGGDRWGKVSPILREWNSEWEDQNA
jgi:hypothetical protein